MRKITFHQNIRNRTFSKHLDFLNNFNDNNETLTAKLLAARLQFAQRLKIITVPVVNVYHSSSHASHTNFDAQSSSGTISTPVQFGPTSIIFGRSIFAFQKVNAVQTSSILLDTPPTTSSLQLILIYIITINSQIASKGSKENLVHSSDIQCRT